MTSLQGIFAHFLPYIQILLDWVYRVLFRTRLSPLTEESLLSKFTLEERRLLFSETLTRRWWYEGFSILLKCYRGDKKLTVAARLDIETRCTDIIKNRLALTRKLAKMDLSQCPIKRPIFIIGPTRSGTSFLLNLLYEDPQNTAPRYYEVMHPVRGEDETETDSRISSEVHHLASLYDAKPGLKKIHYIEAEGAYECYHLMNNIGLFKEKRFLTSNFEEYDVWLRSLTRDRMEEAYRFHKLQMQIILLDRKQGFKKKSEQRVIFKDSIHNRCLEAIIKAYPDALFVHTYRDPRVTTASVCSFLEVFIETLGVNPDLGIIGQDMLTPMAHGGNEMVRFRKEHPELEHRFCDLDFDELVASPMEVVRKIYDFFRIELTAEGEAKMSAYAKEHPKNKYGRHTYDLKRYKLTDAGVMRHFKEYVDFFRPQL